MALVANLIKYPGMDIKVFGFVSGILIIQSFLEILNLVLLIKIISSLSDINSLTTIQIFGFDVSIRNYLIVLGIETVVLALVRYVGLRYITHISYQICRRLNTAISSNVLLASQETFDALDESALKAGLTQKTGLFAHQYLLQYLSIINNVAILAVIICFMVFQQPLYSLFTIFTVMVAYLSIMLGTRKYLVRLGATVSGQQTVLMHLFDKISIIKVPLRYLGSHSKLLKDIDASESALRTSLTDMHVISSAPRIFVEGILISILVLVLLISYVLKLSIDINGLILMGASFQRLLPLAQQIFVNWSNMRGAREIKKDVDNLLNIEIEECDTNVKYDWQHIDIDPNKFRIHEELFVSLNDPRIAQGERILITGASGVGKSTFLKFISGRYADVPMDLNLGIHPYNQLSSGWFYENTLMLDQSDILCGGTILHNIALYQDLTEDQEKLMRKLLREFMLVTSDQECDQFLRRKIGEDGGGVSGGQAQRILLIRSILNDREIYLFDEATSALDHNIERKVLDTIFELRKNSTFIIISHNQQLHDIFDKVITMKRVTV